MSHHDLDPSLRSHEGAPNLEHRLRNPQDFLDDNDIPEAKENRDIYEEMARQGLLWIVRRCSDARGIIPVAYCIDVASIATAGPQKPYNEMHQYGGKRGIIVLGHFDGIEAQEGEAPIFCGGHIVKNKQLEHPEIDTSKGVNRYISALKSKDPLIQNYFSAETTASYTKEPVLTAVQDHRRGRIIPVAEFSYGGIVKKTKLPTRYMLEGQYNPKKIYEHGIPSLPSEYIEAFHDFLKLNKQQVTELRSKYPDLEEMLKVQNPGYVVITTEKMTARGRYPKIFRKPGSYFLVHLPRYIDEYQILNIDQLSIDTVIEQAEYPISESAEHHGSSEKPFSKTHTILIETEDITQSRRIAKSLLEQEWAQNWISLQQHQVLVAESKDGTTTSVDLFQRSMAA